MAFGLEFAVNQLPVDLDFKSSSIGGNQRPAFNVGFKFFEQYVRRTDGSGKVPSNSTVGDRNPQHPHLL